MSEQTGGDPQEPGPDKANEQRRNTGPDDVQDQGAGSVFNDPTAPIWADPTAQMPSSGFPPAPPPPPGTPQPHGAHSADPYGQGQSTPADPPPASNPYGQQPVSNPYAQQPPVPAYGQQPYGQGANPPQYPGYGQQPYSTGQSTQTNGSAIALTIVSALSLCNILSAAPLIMGIIALTRNSTDPVASRRLTKIGWIIFAAVWAVTLLLIAGGIALGILSGDSGGSGSNVGGF